MISFIKLFMVTASPNCKIIKRIHFCEHSNEGISSQSCLYGNTRTWMEMCFKQFVMGFKRLLLMALQHLRKRQRVCVSCGIV